MSWTKDVQAPHGIGTCRTCGNRFVITKTGTVHAHGPHAGPKCPGGGQEPKEHLRMGRDYTPADVYRAMGEPVPPFWAEFEAVAKAQEGAP